MKSRFTLFTLICLSLNFASTALARPELFLLDDVRLNEIRSLITVPDTTHYEAHNALSARVAANDIAGTSSYERGYMAREASFLYLLTGDTAYIQIAYDRLQEIYSISVPDGQAAPDAGSGLGRAQTIISFAMTYNWAYEGLSQVQRDWIAGKVTSGLDQYEAEALSHPNIGYQANNSNWTGVVAGAHVMTLIAMGEERERRFDFQRSREFLRTHLASFGERGWTQEGNFYFGLSMEYVFPAMMALRQIGDPHVEPSFASRRPHHMIMYAGLFNAKQNSLTWGVGGDTMPANGMTSGLLALIPEGEKGFYRWVYDGYRGINNPAAPANKYDYHAAGTIYVLIGYPNDVSPANPKGHYPTVIDDSRGGYVLRSGWDGENDTVVSLWADTGAYGRAWNQLDAGQINILSHGAKWGYGPGPATTGLDTAFSQILVNGLARSEAGTGSMVEHRVAPEGGYAIVSGGSKFSNLGVTQAIRHVMADFSPEGYSIVSTLDRLRSSQAHNYAWNLFQPGKIVTFGTEPDGVAYFLSVDDNGSYLKAWFLVPGTGFTTENQATRYAYNAADIDIRVVMATGSGTPPPFSMVGSGLNATVTLGDSVLTYNPTTERLESSTLTNLNTSSRPTLSASVTRGPAPLNVAFSSSASADGGESLSYAWDFGDGTTNTNASNSHSFTEEGIYLVSLGVVDGMGGADRVLRDIFVGNREPTARIVANLTTVLPGNTVTLNASTSTDPEGETLTYLWELGDGRQMTGETINVSWPTESNYRVELRVEDTAGNINVAQTSIRVENLAPVASFTFDSLGGFVPFEVNFDASASYDPEGEPLLYRWDFNDGTTVDTSIPVIAHTFTQVKNHQVKLTVLDPAGKNNASTKVIAALGPNDVIASIPDPGNLAQGLNYQVYRGDPTTGWNMPEISTLSPLNRGRISNYDLRVTNLTKLFVLVFDGYIFIEETGAHAFRLRTQNETRIHIGNQLLLRSNFPHSDTYQVLVALEAGWHPYRLEMTYNPEDTADRWNRVNITWAPPGTEVYRPVPDDILFSKVSLFQPSFVATPSTVNDGGTVMFEATVNSPDGTSLQYLWDFGDGNTSNLPRIAHTYDLSAGDDHRIYNATLTVTDSSGRALTVGEQITVSRYAGLVMLPQTSIDSGRYDFDKRTTSRDITQAVNQVLEPGVEVTFSSELRPDLGGAMAADGQVSTRWVSSNPQEWMMFRFTNRDGGNRRVNLTEYALTAGGLSWTAYRDPKNWEIYGSNNPQPFSMVPGADNGSWTLIDAVSGQAGVARSMPTIYSLPNNQAYSHYLFHLRNQNDGVSGEVELTEIQLFNYFEHDPNIDGNAAPVPSLTVSNTSGEAPLTLDFDASATVDPDSDWLYYTWDFGDGHVYKNALEQNSMAHNFYEPGTYTVTLTVTDALGKSAQVTEIITINPPLANAAPTVAVSASETEVLVGTEIDFDASASVDSDGDAISYHWEFGDGVSATGALVSHSYHKSGTYNPVLIVTDARGRVSSTFISVEVLPPNGGRPILSFNASQNVKKIAFSRGAGYLPVAYWNNMQQRISPAWYDSNGQPVDIQFSTTGRQTNFIGTQPVDPFDGDAIITQVNSGITAWGSDQGFTIEVDNIPYPVYDVYVYYAGSNAGIKRPVLINGIERWAWKQGYDFPGQWGVSEAASSGEAIQGDNVLLWRNLQSSKVILSLLQREEGHAIAGFQIVDKTGSPDAPPIATIEFPAESSWYYVGSPILLSGSAEDSEGAITDPFLEWSSSIDGVLGNGSSLSVSNLSQGTHTISLKASNNGNLQTTVSVVIAVFAAPSAPVIVSHPQDITSYETATIAFTVEAAGSPPFFTYQWRKGGVPLVDAPGVSGAESDTLTLSGIDSNDVGAYDVILTNINGYIQSNAATLTVTELIAPSITSPPVDTTVNEGSDLVLSVVAGGSAPFTYQWRRNGEALSNGNGISGADTATLTVSPFGLAHEGSYDVVVSNAGDSNAVSAAATVTLFVLPSLDAVLAEWNFNQFSITGQTSGYEETIAADLGSGLLFLRSNFNGGTNLGRNISGGSEINASSGIPAGGSLELRRGERWNTGVVEFRFDMTDYEAAVVSLAYRTSTSLPSTATVEWSADGGQSYTPFTVLQSSDYESGYSLLVLDFSEVAGLTDAADARVRLSYSADGVSGGGLSAALDNVRIAARRSATGYDAWRFEQFGSLEDPDGAPFANYQSSGIPNLIYYALGLDHQVNARDGLPAIIDGFQLKFTRRAQLEVVRLIVEASPILTREIWDPIATLEPAATVWTGSAQVDENLVGDIYNVLVNDPDSPPTAGDTRFLRVRVEIEE